MMRTLSNYSLLGHNTFGIDARCKRFLEFTTVEEAQLVAGMLRSDADERLVIGGGSNLLLTGDFEGTVVHSAVMGIEAAKEAADGHVKLRVGSGVEWDSLVGSCVDSGYHGLENLSLIPGEVGAAAVQNIGAYGAEAKDVISEVEAVSIADGSVVKIAVDECGYGYRRSNFKTVWSGRYLVTHVVFHLSTTFKPQLDYGNIRQRLVAQAIADPTPQQLRQTIIDLRREKLPDPKVQGNGGSFFMNPVVAADKFQQLLAEYPEMPHYAAGPGYEKIPAGWLIEQCGWKGRSMGRAAVHSRQALVIVNLGGATGNEIVRLSDAVKADVKAKFDIDIHPEVNIV